MHTRLSVVRDARREGTDLKYLILNNRVKDERTKNTKMGAKRGAPKTEIPRKLGYNKIELVFTNRGQEDEGVKKGPRSHPQKGASINCRRSYTTLVDTVSTSPLTPPLSPWAPQTLIGKQI